MDAWTPNRLAGAAIGVGLIGILGFLTWALVYRVIPESNRDSMTIILGILSMQVGTIVNAHYGRTLAEGKKDEVIAQQASTIQAAQSALAPREPAIPVAPGESVTVEGQTSS